MPVQTTSTPQNSDKTRPAGVKNQENTRTPRKIPSMSEMGIKKVKSTRMT